MRRVAEGLPQVIAGQEVCKEIITCLYRGQEKDRGGELRTTEGEQGGGGSQLGFIQ